MQSKMSNSQKWHVLVGCFICYMFDAADLLFLSMALPSVIKDWQLPMANAGLLGTATLIGVAVSAVTLGWFADKYGRRKALIISVITYVVFTCAVAYVQTYEQFLILRFLTGLGLGGVWGVAAAYVGEAWPAEQRGRALAFVLSSFPLGYAISAILALLIMGTYGWRMYFLVGGAMGAVALIYIFAFMQESEIWLKEKRKAMAGVPSGETKKTTSSSSFGELFSASLWRNTVFGTLMVAAILMAYWGVNTWLPTFLIKERGIDLSLMSWMIVSMQVAMFIGYQVFGYLGDRIGRRKTLMIIYAGLTIFLPLFAQLPGKNSLFFIGLALFFCFAFTGVFGAYFAELFPTNIRALGAGFCFNVGRGFSALAPFMLGSIAAKHSLQYGFTLCGGLFLVGLVMVFLLPETIGKKSLETS